MESCIKYSYHRCVRHKFLACCNTEKVRRIVERSQVYTFFQSFYHHVVDKYRMREFFAGMYYSVTYCTDLAHIFDYTVIFILYSHQYV